MKIQDVLSMFNEIEFRNISVPKLAAEAELTAGEYSGVLGYHCCWPERGFYNCILKIENL